MCNPSKEMCFLALEVDAGSAFFQWVEPRASSSGCGLSPGLLMATDKILVFQSQTLTLPALQGRLHASPWALALHSRIPALLVQRRTQEELGLDQLQSADLEHACYRQITAAKRWLWFILFFSCLVILIQTSDRKVSYDGVLGPHSRDVLLCNLRRNS